MTLVVREFEATQNPQVASFKSTNAGVEGFLYYTVFHTLWFTSIQ